MEHLRGPLPRRWNRTGYMTRDVNVWVVSLQGPLGRRLQSRKHVLNPVERERGDRFLLERDRRAYVLAHILVREVLSRFEPAVRPNEWRFETAQGGRPELSAEFAATGLRFNISHTAGLVACVVTPHVDCGIDVERHFERDNVMALARRSLSPTQLAALEAVPLVSRSTEFLRYWTFKEARVKALGKGLLMDLREVESPLDRFARPGQVAEPERQGCNLWQDWQWQHQSRFQAALSLRHDIRTEIRQLRLVVHDALL